MGTVYKAQDRKLGRRFISVEGDSSRARGYSRRSLHRFKQELILARQVTHKNAIRIFDLGEARRNQVHYHGVYRGTRPQESLLVKQGINWAGKNLVANHRADLLRVEVAYGEGVVHRDLKPQNIMLDKSGRHLRDGFWNRSFHRDARGTTQTGTVARHAGIYVSRTSDGRARGRALRPVHAGCNFLRITDGGRCPHKG